MPASRIVNLDDPANYEDDWDDDDRRNDQADYDDGDDSERDCTHCGGEPFMVECDDPIQCCKPSCDGTWHGCDACNGTGLRSQQWSF